MEYAPTPLTDHPPAQSMTERDQIVEAERQHVWLIGRINELLTLHQVLAEHAAVRW